MQATVRGKVTSAFIDAAKGKAGSDEAGLAVILARMQAGNRQAGRSLFEVSFPSLFVGADIVSDTWQEGLKVISGAGVPVHMEEMAATLYGQEVECTFRVPSNEAEHAMVADFRPV